ncbi:MAG: efflux RND transporter periplasmic adaptor subunit, partial [Gallionella sp.]
DLSRMQIDANFAEADIGNIQIGQTVRFTVDAFPNRSFKGVVKLIRLNPTTVSNVVTYDVVINVDNPEQILLPGMTAYVSIAVAERKDVLLVPNAALRFKPAGTGIDQKRGGAANSEAAKPKRDALSGKVYVLDKDELKPVSVSLGITDNRNTEIVDGELKAGDQIVVGEVNDTGNSKTDSTSPMRMRLF